MSYAYRGPGFSLVYSVFQVVKMRRCSFDNPFGVMLICI